MTIGGFFTAILFGLIIGGLAKLIVPGKQNIPIWMTLIIGIVGALIGTYLAVLLKQPTGGFNLIETLLQIGAAVVLVLIVVAVWPRRGVKS